MLAGAIVTEVAATLSLKAALSQPLWYVVVVCGYISAFWLVAQAMRRGMPLGVAYGVWASVGVAATALLSHVFYDEPLTLVMLAGLGLIIAGVLLVELGSQHAQRRAAARAQTQEG